jgi:cytochrome c oxidase subunit 3/cytochrome o ubiquinol oxidase subunit 3
VLALAAIQRGDMRRFKVWVMATAVFGMLFIGGQIFEFTEFYREGMSLRTNVSSSIFFVATGLHGLHVTVGIIWLLSLWGMAMQGKFGQKDSEAVEVSGLYWHFVDVVWIVIFAVVYLIP